MSLYGIQCSFMVGEFNDLRKEEIQNFFIIILHSNGNLLILMRKRTRAVDVVALYIYSATDIK